MLTYLDFMLYVNHNTIKNLWAGVLFCFLEHLYNVMKLS